MAEILTSKLKSDIVRLFYDDLQNNDYYFMVSATSPDTLTRVPSVNAQRSKTQFKEKILFGKKIFLSDIKFMIKYYPWQKDEVYTQYDDLVDISSEKFYAVVGPTNNDSGDYRVYKCLSNNNGSPSTIPPNYNPTTVNQIYRTADDYVWKYMYRITVPHFEAYNSSGYVPLEGNFEINPDPLADANNVISGSEVSDIFVENYIDNNGYPFVNNGFLNTAPGNQGQFTIRSDELNTGDVNYYAGMWIYVYSDNVGYVYEIDNYIYDGTAGVGRVTVIGDPQADGLKVNSPFKIVPKVTIRGDGTGAVAVPRIVDGRITNVDLLDAGSNYTNITAVVEDPPYDFSPEDKNTVDVRAVLRPILSPEGYHGWNLIDEMHCRHVLIYAYITETDNNKIGATGTFSAVGVVKNPEFGPDASANTASPEVFDNRLAIITDDYGKAAVDTVLIQRDALNEVTFSARVHEIDEDNSTIYLSDYMGAYQNAANNDISLDTTLPLINSTGQRIAINTPVANNIIESRYTQRSGTVYFMEDFFPLERFDSSREEYKLVLEF